MAPAIPNTRTTTTMTYAVIIRGLLSTNQNSTEESLAEPAICREAVSISRL
jgi:hypothetical protein